MITIKLLKNHPEVIPTLAAIWHEVLGKIWVPDILPSRVIERLSTHLNEDNLPLTFIALDGNKPVGMCSLRENDGIQPNLMPWLGSLVADPNYHNKGIGKILIDTIKKKAKGLGFKKLYLFTFDPTLPNYYAKLGWKIISLDQFKGHRVTVMEREVE